MSETIVTLRDTQLSVITGRHTRTIRDTQLSVITGRYTRTIRDLN